MAPFSFDQKGAIVERLIIIDPIQPLFVHLKYYKVGKHDKLGHNF